MGSRFTKEDKPMQLSPEESAFVQNTFKLLSHDKDYLKSEDLIEAWSYLVDPEFVEFLKDSCFRKSHNAPIKMKPFEKYFYVVVKGSVFEKALYIATKIFDNKPRRPQGVVATKLQSFVTSTVRSYFIMLNQNKPREYQSWVDNGVSIDQVDIENYSQHAIKELMNSTRVSIGQLEQWLCHHPLFMQIWKEVVMYLYSRMNSIKLPEIDDPRTLPFCNIPECHGPLDSILSIGEVIFMNDALPVQYRRQWTPLFNSKLHGESFSTLTARITHKGPTILVIRDEDNYVFGGFAPSSWNVGPKFIGDLTTCLFTLKPQMQRFITSGYNDHFQYMNTNQQTIPNGLGMGGQYDYWGLWLDEEFVRGHTSESCSTFTGYVQMSSQKDFQLQHLEVWSVGEQRLVTSDADEPHPTILTHLGADKFLLELSGREFHSDGIGEPEESPKAKE